MKVKRMLTAHPHFCRALVAVTLCLLACLTRMAGANPDADPIPKPNLAKTPLMMCVSDAAIPPHTFPDREGLAQILFRRAAQAQGLSVHFVAEPSLRCLNDVSRGTMQGTPLLGDSVVSQSQYASPQRDAKFDVKRSSASTDLVFVVRKGSRVRWDGVQLSGNNAPVMVRPGFHTNVAWLTSRGIPFQTSAATVKQIGQMIAADRADVALLQTMEAEMLHRQAEVAGQLQTLTPSAATPHGYAVFNREFAEANRPLVEAVWNEIGRIRASKEWKTFATKFERDVLQSGDTGVEHHPRSEPPR